MVFFPRNSLYFRRIYLQFAVVALQPAVGEGKVAMCSFQVFQFFITVILVKYVPVIEEQHKDQEHRGYHDVFVLQPVRNVFEKIHRSNIER